MAKHEFTNQLSDLEFVEDLSEDQLTAVAGGAVELDPDVYIKKVFADLAETRAKAEGNFKRRFPELAPLIFSDPNP